MKHLSIRTTSIIMTILMTVTLIPTYSFATEEVEPQDDKEIIAEATEIIGAETDGIVVDKANEFNTEKGSYENDSYRLELHEDVIIQNEKYHVDRICVGGIVHVWITDADNLVLWSGSASLHEIGEPSLSSSTKAEIRDENLLKGVNWGSWSSKSYTKKIAKVEVAIVLGFLIVYCPYAPVKALATVASMLVLKYNYVTVKVQSRTGKDSKYVYVQHKYTIYGRQSKNGAKTKVYGPTTFTHKEKL